MKKKHPWRIIIIAGILVPLFATFIELLTPDKSVDINNWPILLLLPVTLIPSIILYVILKLFCKSDNSRQYLAIGIAVVANFFYVLGIVIRVLKL